MSEIFQINGKRLVVSCPAHFDPESTVELAAGIESRVSEISSVVLNFQETKKFDPRYLLRFIGGVGKFLRTQRIEFQAIHSSPELATELRVNGLDSTIKLTSLEPDRPVAAPQKKKFNVEIINTFVVSTLKTLQTQCNTEVTSDGKPFLKGSKPLPAIDIMGVIALTSNEFVGTISICFPEKTFLGAMGGMLGETYTEITSDLEDGVGELLNIIFGQSKVILNEKGFGIQKAIPTVIRAKDLKVRQHSLAPVLLFTCPHGQFYMEIAAEEDQSM